MLFSRTINMGGILHWQWWLARHMSTWYNIHIVACWIVWAIIGLLRLAPRHTADGVSVFLSLIKIQKRDHRFFQHGGIITCDLVQRKYLRKQINPSPLHHHQQQQPSCLHCRMKASSMLSHSMRSCDTAAQFFRLPRCFVMASAQRFFFVFHGCAFHGVSTLWDRVPNCQSFETRVRPISISVSWWLSSAQGAWIFPWLFCWGHRLAILCLAFPFPLPCVMLRVFFPFYSLIFHVSQP